MAHLKLETDNELQARPGDYHLLKNWFNFMREVMGISHTGGYARLDLSVWVDGNGRPQFWEKPVVTRIHPRSCNVNEVLNEQVKEETQ